MNPNLKQVKIGNGYGTIPVGSAADSTATVAQKDAYYQNLANTSPELADTLMNAEGYTNNVITPDALQPQPKITLPTTPTPAPTKPASIDYDAMFGLTDFEKQAQQTQEQGLSEIIKSMTALEGEATDLQAERQRQGLQDKYRENQATKARILALDAEMQQDDIQLAQKLRVEERRDTLLPFAQMGQAKLAGDAAIYRALKTAEKNTLISQQLAQQGDIALAEQFAKDAISAKYAPYKQNIENFKTIMEVIKTTLTAAENKLLKVQEMKATRAENEIKKAEEEEKSIEALKLKIIENGGDPNTITSTNYSEALNQAKGSLMKKDIQVKELNGALYAVTTTPDGKVSVKFVAGGGGGTGNGTNKLYSGLNSTQATAVRGLTTKFSSEPVVTGFSTIQEGRNFANSLSNTTTNPADDQGLIYALAKALDPNSVVREGEYATAQKYSQSWVKAYGKGVEQALAGTGFLSEEARKNIKKTIESKYNASKASYDNLRKSYSTGIDKITGKVDGKDYLREYEIGVQEEMPKGTMSDRDYVEKVLVSNNIKYDEFINTTPQGQIPVIDNSTGQIGYIPYTEFNSSKYTKI